MTVLKNSRHERFAQELSKGKTATDAYEMAGYKANRQHAHRLVTNGDVRKRVSELQAKVAEKAEWSAADRLAALKRISDAAEQDDPRVAVSAISEANKMQGSHAPAKRELSGPGGGAIPIDLTNATDDELAALKAIFGPLAGGTGDDDEGDTGGGS